MTYLLDVSPLLALLWQTHVHHARVTRWVSGLDLAVCPEGRNLRSMSLLSGAGGGVWRNAPRAR